MLGRLEMSVQECIDAYIHLSEQVFGTQKIEKTVDTCCGEGLGKVEHEIGLRFCKTRRSDQSYNKKV